MNIQQTTVNFKSIGFCSIFFVASFLIFQIFDFPFGAFYDINMAVFSLISAELWISSATKTAYSLDERRSEEERKRLSKLQVERNVEAAMLMGMVAFMNCLKLILPWFEP